jgi:hypothetical protein
MLAPPARRAATRRRQVVRWLDAGADRLGIPNGLRGGETCVADQLDFANALCGRMGAKRQLVAKS